MKQVRVERKDKNGGDQFSAAIEAIFENGTTLQKVSYLLVWVGLLALINFII